MPPGVQPVSGARHSNRDRFVDSWRGIFHVVMIVDHLPFMMPGMIPIISGLFEFLGFISVAEGFVFLSGFVSGLVYTRIRREKGDRAVWRKALIRARDIYLVYLLAVLVLTLLLKYGGETSLDWRAWKVLLDVPLPVALIKTGLLLYQPTFIEILPMYCLFILVTPVVLKQLDLGRQFVVMICSVLVWISSQFGIRNALINAIPIGIDVQIGVFNSFSWQILFVGGLLCGYKTLTNRGPWLPTGRLFTLWACVIAAILFCLRHGPVEMSPEEAFVSRSSLGPLRLVNFASIVFLVSRARGLIERLIAWQGFAFLSRHSLQVFAFHLIPIYVAGLVLGNRTSLSIGAQLFVVASCILSLFLVAFLTLCSKKALVRLNAWSGAMFQSGSKLKE